TDIIHDKGHVFMHPKEPKTESKPKGEAVWLLIILPLMTLECSVFVHSLVAHLRFTQGSHILPYVGVNVLIVVEPVHFRWHTNDEHYASEQNSQKAPPRLARYGSKESPDQVHI